MNIISKEKEADCRQALAALPAIGVLVQRPLLTALCAEYPVDYIHSAARREVEYLRKRILEGEMTSADQVPKVDELALRIKRLVERELQHSVRRAINASGVLLHTGLGRAPLPPAAQEALREAVERYSLLALDVETGKRGDRMIHIERLLCDLTGAEAALAVNNNAAAVMLILNTFAAGKQAVISRGELVEIGGMFRIPDVMQRAGVDMVEVGTTNKTHLRDYENALTERSALIVKVHQSNYRIAGFTKDVPLRELAGLAQIRNIPLFYDLGSGALVDLKRWGLPEEPSAPQAIADGADIVSFSGDKLIGGPQCGIIIGKNKNISFLRQNPLLRALRLDKLSISALNGTLRLFLEPEKLPGCHPLYRMMTESADVVQRRARRILRRLKPILDDDARLEIVSGFSMMGSGSLPAQDIPSKLVVVSLRSIKPDDFARKLRYSSPSVVVRIENDAIILDARTIADNEIGLLGQAFKTALQNE
ncbi:MAG: L-seryl-tRNA(Sec) selenium transferase [Calditrichaeota bacterium]|nr:L-seryl-tRNA(Sec) selenium transferase [Calditrichota bacterium]